MDCNSCKSELCDMRRCLEIKYYGYQLKTKGDKIRAMMDEEFAKAASDTFRCPADDYKCLKMPDPSCYDCWLAWLKQPVEEET